MILTFQEEMRVVVLFGLLLIAAIGMAVEELKAEEGGRWWYTPSRKAPLYEHKYQGIRDQLVRAAARQGEDMRLPTDVLPTSYTIRLLPFIEVGNFTTDGHIEILVECKRNTSSISMNAADLTIDNKTVSVRAILITIQSMCKYGLLFFMTSIFYYI